MAMIVSKDHKFDDENALAPANEIEKKFKNLEQKLAFYQEEAKKVNDAI
jgi:hypothetical protein